jgi:hypothetical protein
LTQWLATTTQPHLAMTILV